MGGFASTSRPLACRRLPVPEQITPENHGPWTIHGGEHCGVRIDGPNGRAVLHVIQRDPHPALRQGITQAESQAIAEKVVALWNAALTPKPTAWLRYDGMKAMPADEKEAYQQLTDSLSKSIVAEYTIPLYTSGVPPSAAPERVEVGRLVLPATNDEWGEPEIDAFMGRLEALQERIQKGNGRMELAVFVEVPAVGVATVDGGKHG
jgi:hypothetical protein